MTNTGALTVKVANGDNVSCAGRVPSLDININGQRRRHRDHLTHPSLLSVSLYKRLVATRAGTVNRPISMLAQSDRLA